MVKSIKFNQLPPFHMRNEIDSHVAKVLYDISSSWPFYWPIDDHSHMTSFFKGDINLLEFAEKLHKTKRFHSFSYEFHGKFPVIVNEKEEIAENFHIFRFEIQNPKMTIEVKIFKLSRLVNYFTFEFKFSGDSFGNEIAGRIIFELLKFCPKGHDEMIIDGKIYSNDNWESYENFLKMVFINHFLERKNISKHEERLKGILKSQRSYEKWISLVRETL